MVRVIIAPDHRNKEKVAFFITNLSSSVSSNIDLQAMYFCWKIENFFKKIKSYTQYRVVTISSESLTKHLCRSMFLQELENLTSKFPSVHKCTTAQVLCGDVTCLVSQMIIKLFSLYG